MIELQKSSIIEEVKRSDHYLRIGTDAVLYLDKNEILNLKPVLYKVFKIIIENFDNITNKTQTQLREALNYIDHELYCYSCE